MISKIKCLFGRHDLESVGVISFQSEKMKCKSCGKKFAVNHHLGLVIPWKDDVAGFYKEFFENIEKIKNDK